MEAKISNSVVSSPTHGTIITPSKSTVGDRRSAITIADRQSTIAVASLIINKTSDSMETDPNVDIQGKLKC